MNYFDFSTMISDLVNETDVAKKVEKYDKLLAEAKLHFINDVSINGVQPTTFPSTGNQPTTFSSTGNQPTTSPSTGKQPTTFPSTGNSDGNSELEFMKKCYAEQQKQLAQMNDELNRVKEAYADRFNFNKVQEVEPKPEENSGSAIDNLFDNGGN